MLKNENHALFNQTSLSKIRSYYPSLFEAEQKVADYILENPERCMSLAIADLADKAHVAASTVNRFCQSIGFSGFKDFKLALARDSVMPIHLTDARISQDDDLQAVKDKIFQSDIQTLLDSVQLLNTGELEKAIHAIACAKRIDLYGVGSAVAIVNDLYYWMSHIGVICHPCLDSNIQKMIASQSDADTVSIGISHSGVTKHTVEALQMAKAQNATTIAITNYAKTPIVDAADIVLLTASRNTALRSVSMTSRVAHMAVNDLLVLGVARKKQESANSSLKKSADALIGEKLVDLN